MNPLPERIGPYKIQRSIGKGGFGEVFAAADEYTGQIVALKVLLPEVVKDVAVVARFIGEARALAALNKHPGVVTVYRFDKTADGVPYLAMELLEGKTLRNWQTERENTISLDAALTIGQQVANIMVDVHSQGFVHRDLKPENIMLVADERSSLGVRPILLDFGIAKVTVQAPFDDQSPTRVITAGIDVLGSVVYMAPEQFKNADEIDEKADVYVLGLVVYELIAGKPPFQSNEPVELILMHGRDRPANLHDIVPSVPPNLATFVASILAKTPEDRPSMRDCRDMFARDWAHEDIECPFPGLSPFKDSQAHLFFGRRAETLTIRAKLDEIHEGNSRRWLQIQGPSGTGKSSLVHAAILPVLETSKEWRVITMRPAEDPIRSMAIAFSIAYEGNEADVVAAFRESPDALNAFVKKHHATDTKLLLVIDQFEELFALGGALRPTFEALIAKAFENVDSPLRLLTTIRSDYLHRFDQVLGLAKLLDHHALRYDLRPMDEAALAEVIDGMAGRAGLRLSEGLPRKMVQDATGTDCRLPLLGHALRSLWSLRSGGAITHEHYERTGGVGGALAKHAEELLTALGDDGRERAKWLVLDLVQPGRGAPDTRRPRAWAEVVHAAGTDKLAEDVLMGLSGVATMASEVEHFRLVVISGDALDPNRQSVDLVHEMVLQKVPVIVAWINEERELLERLVTLEGAANAWIDAGRPKDGLPFGSLLDHYRGGTNGAQRARLERMASAEAREFLGEAIRQQRRRTWMLRGFGAAMIAAVVAIVVSAVVARDQRIQAERARTRAESAHTLAKQEAEHAEKNLLAVLDTTDKIINDVDWPMGRIGHTMPLRRNIMEPLYAQLLELEKSDPSGLRIRLIETEQRLGDLERLHGKIGEASRFVAEADRRITSALILEPHNLDFIALQAMNLSKRGKLRLVTDDAKGALKDFTDSIREFKRSQTEDLDKQALATSHVEKGDAFTALKEFDLARQSYTDGLLILRPLAETANPVERPYARALEAEALVLRASVTSDSATATQDLNDALEIAASLVKEQDYNLFFRSILGMTHLRIAALHRAAERWPKAKVEYEVAMTIGESLHKDAPEQKEYALLLIEALIGLESTGRDDVLRERRCKLVQSFVDRDPSDLRFKKIGCK